jgi:hypothetical protein
MNAKPLIIKTLMIILGMRVYRFLELRIMIHIIFYDVA